MYKLHYDNFLINEHDDDDDDAQQRTVVQLNGGWYTERWWVNVWYREEGSGRAAAICLSPPFCAKCNSPPTNGQHTNCIIRCDTIITFALYGVNINGDESNPQPLDRKLHIGSSKPRLFLN